MPIIEFRDVTFAYPNGYSAVEQLSFSVEAGARIAILGQNGAGKTTTVKMMDGLLRPSSGKVLIDGEDTREHTTAQMSRIAGYVFQNPDDQIFHNTVGEEIAFGPKMLKLDADTVEEQSKWAATICGLDRQMEENPYDLPLSARKFVTIASVLAMRTRIVILDEPTAGQDYRGLNRLGAILEELTNRGVTVIAITHDMQFAAEHFSTFFVMAHKKLLRTGTAKEIFQDQALLDESMLERPFASELALQLGLGADICTREELAKRLLAGGGVKP